MKKSVTVLAVAGAFAWMDAALAQAISRVTLYPGSATIETSVSFPLGAVALKLARRMGEGGFSCQPSGSVYCSGPPWAASIGGGVGAFVSFPPVFALIGAGADASLSVRRTLCRNCLNASRCDSTS